MEGEREGCKRFVFSYVAPQTFKPEPYWQLEARVQCAGRTLRLAWERGRLFDRDAANVFLRIAQQVLFFSSFSAVHTSAIAVFQSSLYLMWAVVT